MSGDLTIGALYTSQVWTWGGLSCADLLATPDAKRVFDVTNAVLGVARILRREVSPLRYALLHRHTMIDHLLHDAAPHRVIELAAGLSRRGAANCRDRAYLEIDLPPMIARKRKLFERTPQGREVLEHLQLRGEDVEHLVLSGEPGFVIAEGLVMYLGGAQRRRLFAMVAKVADTFVFDLVPTTEEPEPGAVGRVLEAGMKRFTGGTTFVRDAKTREQILTELQDAGFATADAITSRQVARDWGLPYADRDTTMVVFSASRSTRA